jgi:hypothetical protein
MAGLSGAGGGGGGGGMPGMEGGGGGGMPGGKVMEAYQKGGSKSDQAMRMGGAAVGEAAEGIGKAAGPEGAVIGKAVSEAASMGTEGAIAAKNLIMSGGSLASQKAAAVAFKSNIVDKIWWPGMMQFPMNFLLFLPMLQVYWLASLSKSSWTTELRMWEHAVIFLLSLVEAFLIITFLAMLGAVGCMVDYSNCGRNYVSSALGI